MYPTKEQILKTKPKIRQTDIEITKIWKTTWIEKWRDISKEQKIELLKELTLMLSLNHKLEIHFKNSFEYAYEKESKTIYINKENPSIISFLHELGHHLKGDSELQACRWAIWLFKECFPGLYSKLTWKGHLLKRIKNNPP